MADQRSELDARARALAPDFALDREIGRGGMGVVYQGVDVRLERPVAIKVLPETLGDVPDIRERFLREARTAAKLSHQNIVPIYRADESGGVVFIVMALVDGESLADRLATRGALPPRELVPLLRDVAAALDHAHGHGVVHRDVKPENILIERATGRAMVTDFGIARVAEAKPLTATGQVLGTVHYMSPEQVSGEPVDGRSDLYSLGVVAFRALTGRLPFDNESASAVLVAHVVKAPPRVRDVAPDAPRALAELIDRCLAKDPATRGDAAAAIAPLFDEALAESRVDDAMPSVLSEREARSLWSRAAELQAMTGVETRPPALRPMTTGDGADRRSLTSGYKMADVREAAAEAGIPERYVARAASELGLARPSPNETAGNQPLVDETPAASPWAGAPMSIMLELRVVGEVPESELYILIDTIRRRIGDPGHVGSIGRSVSWSSADKHRRVQISIVPRHGFTTIRIDERLGGLAGALFGGIMGGGGGGTTGVTIGLGMGVFHSALIAAGLWGSAVVGTYTLARTIFKAQVKSRRAALHALALELAEQARETVRLLPRR
jgi:serine/threonine-protein kinase